MPNVVLFFAFGTQGDAQPLAVLATALARARPDLRVVFATHAVHKALFSAPFGLCGVVFHGIDSPPVSLRSSQEASLSASTDPAAVSSVKRRFDSTTDGGTDYGSAVRECSEGAFGPSNKKSRMLPPATLHTCEEAKQGWGEESEAVHREGCLRAVKDYVLERKEDERALIVFNLFALEGFHLAEYCAVPCLAAAPYMVPYSAPAGFDRRFEREHPALYRRLQEAEKSEVGWGEVEQWMWPLFTSRWATWREQRLSLSPCPLTDPVTELPILYDWPTAVPLLYGFSPAVVGRPGYWPQSIRVCGFWFPSSDWRRPALTKSSEQTSDVLKDKANDVLLHGDSQTLEGLLRIVADSRTPPICIGFSSIGSMGFLKDPSALLHTLLGALKIVNKWAVLLTGGSKPLEDAVLCEMQQQSHGVQGLPQGFGDFGTLSMASEVGAEETLVSETWKESVAHNEGGLLGGRLLCLFRSIPHELLLPRCELAIHHGGSGTTAAALRAGIPQVVCPFMFDQFYWAERMHWIGVAATPLGMHHLMPRGGQATFEAASATIASAIGDALKEEVKERAKQLRDIIQTEDGVAVALTAMLELLRV